MRLEKGSVSTCRQNEGWGWVRSSWEGAKGRGMVDLSSAPVPHTEHTAMHFICPMACTLQRGSACTPFGVPTCFKGASVPGGRDESCNREGLDGMGPKAQGYAASSVI